MGSLIHQIAQISDALYGVNILEDAPPAGIPGVGTNRVAVVANLPWGPATGVVSITTPAELFATFCPIPFGALNDYPAMKAFLNKTFPSTIKIARVAVTGAVAADFDFQDDDPDDSVTVTAKYPGALGNSITVAWTANADDATARDATVKIGTAYTATYRLVAQIVGSALVVTDPGDPYVTFAAMAGADEVPAVIGDTALTSGADGTAIAGDYSDAIERFADASVGWEVGFVAEPESALLAGVNTALKTYEDTHDAGIWVLCTPVAESSSTALTAAGSLRSDRLFKPWPRVKTINQYDPNRAETTVDGAAFAAVALASVDPEISPGGAPGAPYLRGITGIEQAASLITLNALNAGGISPFFMSDANEGAILHNAVLTTLTPGQTRVFRRRMTDYIVQSIAAFLERYVGKLLDLNLATQSLGVVTGPEIAQVKQFLQDLQDTNRIAAFGVDPFSQNVQSNINNGVWIILIQVQLYSAQEKIVLRAQIGETVTVTIDA